MADQLSAIYNQTKQASGTNETGTTLNITKKPSSAAGVVPLANTGDFRASQYYTASVLGTGANADTLLNNPEAV